MQDFSDSLFVRSLPFSFAVVGKLRLRNVIVNEGSAEALRRSRVDLCWLRRAVAFPSVFRLIPHWLTAQS